MRKGSTRGDRKVSKNRGGQGSLRVSTPPTAAPTAAALEEMCLIQGQVDGSAPSQASPPHVLQTVKTRGRNIKISNSMEEIDEEDSATTLI